ncbi:nucleoside deoxyribosyltransferase [Arthrobacter phage Powerpuff]|nr:nucleoside deoxyribosyltransferase [Arthrobacter phage Powerpuff]QIN94427.1 nucleoside deoxyribosyltransferase [Arthrobacter phage Lego]QIN94518.1 nucleoside deoxyribosyltransferase [Arthrobacter phage YesChef]
MRLYLAGPMTGYPRWNFDAFERGASALRSAGFEVLCPAEADLAEGFDPDAPEHHFTREHLLAALRRDAEMVLASDGVALLDGWRHSKGALAERALARAAGLPARPVALWLADGPTPQEGQE